MMSPTFSAAGEPARHKKRECMSGAVNVSKR
jgi:hypothetical protein